MPREVRTPAYGRALARRLISALTSGDLRARHAAADMIASPPGRGDLTAERILADPAQVKRKHALNAVAFSWGHAHWPEFMAAYEAGRVSEDVVFVYVDNWGTRDVIRYYPNDAQGAVYHRENGAPMGLEEEEIALENYVPGISHRRDQAMRRGEHYALSDEDKIILCRLHWLQNRAAPRRTAGPLDR